MTTASSTFSRVAPRLRTHEHGWITESRHQTSEGVIIYVRCVECGAHRIDRGGLDRLDREPTSRIVGG